VKNWFQAFAFKFNAVSCRYTEAKKGEEDKATRGLEVVSIDDPRLEELVGEELRGQLMEDIELLDELGGGGCTSSIQATRSARKRLVSTLEPIK
jgi:hypothetical protein